MGTRMNATATKTPTLAEAIAPPGALAAKHIADNLCELVAVEITGKTFRSYSFCEFTIEVADDSVSVIISGEVFFSPIEGEFEAVYPCGTTLAFPVSEFLKSDIDTWETFALLLVERAWPAVFATWAEETDFYGFGFDGLTEIELFSELAAGNMWRIET